MLTEKYGYDILNGIEGVASALCVTSQHTGRKTWLVLICETHVGPWCGRAWSLFVFLTPSTVPTALGFFIVRRV